MATNYPRIFDRLHFSQLSTVPNQTMILQLQILGNLFLSMILGGIIGYEREAANKPAGLRTHMLVTASATFLTSQHIRF